MRKMNIMLHVIMVSTITLALLGGCSKSAAEEEVDLGANSPKSTTETEKVVTINDKTFTKEDLALNTLVEKIKIELGRAEDVKRLEGEVLQNKNDYWDEQLQYIDNVNVQLQSLIEIYAMSLLAEEKNYFIPEDKLAKAVKKWNSKTSGIDPVQQLIAAYGKAEYELNIREVIRQSMLRDRIIEDLEKELTEENVDITEKELNYLLGQRYEELYMDQLKDLDLQIHMK